MDELIKLSVTLWCIYAMVHLIGGFFVWRAERELEELERKTWRARMERLSLRD